MSMSVKPVPEGFHTVTPYLLVGDVGSLIDFLTKAFDAKEWHRSALPDGTVTHADVVIGDSHVMMGSARGEWAAMPCMIYLYVSDTDAVYRQALAAGATSMMAPADQFYGDRNAGVKDPFGNLWWIATHIEDVPPEELKRRHEEYAKKQGGAAS
jgi:PhnB protein